MESRIHLQISTWNQENITFIAHGLPKFEDVTGTQGFFGNIGLPPELALPIGLPR
jgi:hypothetical protein